MTKHRFQNRIFDKLPGEAVRMHAFLKEVLGTVNAALWMCQVLYWYDKSDLPRGIRKSRSELESETGLTRDQQIRVESALKELGVVAITVRPGRPSPINHIVVNFDVFDSLISYVLETRRLNSFTREPDNLIDLKRVHQYTHNADNIAETTHENIKKNISTAGYEKAAEVRNQIVNKGKSR